jgi:hypothetical protein
MRRLLYTFYDIPSEPILEEYYDEDNMDIGKYFDYSGTEREDIDVLHEPRPHTKYNYEHFSALVYVYFFNLAIDINIVVFKDTNGGLNGGSVSKILFRICEWWGVLDDYDNFISTLKAERYKDEYLLRAVYAFIIATAEDPHFLIESFKSNFFSSLKSEKQMIENTRNKLTELDIDIEKTSLNTPKHLTRMVIKLCDYALKHGYTCHFFCKNLDADTEDVMLIVRREQIQIQQKTIDVYKIKNSWGSECVGDVGFMNIRSGYIKLDDLSNKNCGLIVGLPTKLQQPNKLICRMMNDIVYGSISIIEFNARIKELFDEEERGRVEGEVAVHPDILYRKTVPGFVSLRPLREPSESVSNQTQGTCYAHVIARLMRRLLYTFYKIHSKTSEQCLYHEDNLYIVHMFRLINKEREDPEAYNNYYEHFSALVYLYFFNLAIHINIVVFKNTHGGMKGGNTTKILVRICEDWKQENYEDFIKIMKAEKYKREKLLIGVYDFLCATATDPHLELELFRNIRTEIEDINEDIIKGVQNKLTQLKIDFDVTEPVTPDVLTRMIIKLCDHALKHGYTCPYFCRDWFGGHVVLIVGRESVDDKTIYKIKNSWGTECIGDAEFMGITANYLQLENIYKYNKICGLIVVLPKKTKQPNKLIRDTMNDIVYGDIENFNERIKDLFDEEQIVAKKERLVDGEVVVVQVEEPISARGRSQSRKGRSPSRKGRKSRKTKSLGRKTKSLGRKTRSPGRKTRSLRTRSLGGKRGGKNTLKKRRAHKKPGWNP